ncbi:hypothetical protein [Sulfobacillus sp. hq2]|uniref:hypothetical protein n=1 Tax=Sulfobacillus TaxID=28033 RepID=UPI0015702D01|nr:hypothetical protein [Sulfobacillus sp. hq2]MCY0907536.1 hypothetical protein [Sulfobacillus thermotolerans]
MQNSDLLADEARGYFLALADVLRELDQADLLGRLAELYMEFRQIDYYSGRS